MYSTMKSFINTILGIIGTFFGAIFQFSLIYLIIKFYGAQMNGLIRTIMAVTFTIGLAESSIGIMGIFYLYRPLAKKDWITVNDIIGTIKDNYMKTGLMYLTLILSLGAGFSLYTYWTSLNQITTIENPAPQLLPFWQLWVVIIALSLKNLIAFFFVGAYENLLQADNRNYFVRIVQLTADLIVFTGVIAMMWLLARNRKSILYLPFLVYIVHGVIKSAIIFLYVRLKYPWLKSHDWVKNETLLRESNNVVIKSYATAIFNNLDFVLIAFFVGFRTASAYSIYMTVALNLRVVALLFITSFKDFFGTWISYQGRVRWNTFVKFELFAYMIAAFMFIIQFILSPYFVNALFGNLREQMLANIKVSENVAFENQAISTIFELPHLSLIFAINSAITMISEPASILIYAAGRHKETTKQAYIQVGISLVISLTLGAVFTYYLQNAALTMYALVLSTTFGLLYRWVYSSSYCWKYLTYNSNTRFWWKNLAIFIIPIGLAVFVAYKYIFPNSSSANYQFKDYDLLSSQMGIKGILWLLFLIVVTSVPAIITLAAIIEPLQLLAILSRSSLTKWIVNRLKHQKEDADFYNRDELSSYDDPDKIKDRSWKQEEQRKSNLQVITRKSLASNKEAVYILKGKN